MKTIIYIILVVQVLINVSAFVIANKTEVHVHIPFAAIVTFVVVVINAILFAVISVIVSLQKAKIKKDILWSCLISLPSMMCGVYFAFDGVF